MKIKEVCSKVAFNSTSVAISKLIGDYIFWWCENVLEIWLEQKKFCKVAWNLFHHILIRKIRPFTPINHAHGHMILAERGWGKWGWTPLPPITVFNALGLSLAWTYWKRVANQNDGRVFLHRSFHAQPKTGAYSCLGMNTPSILQWEGVESWLCLPALWLLIPFVHFEDIENASSCCPSICNNVADTVA